MENLVDSKFWKNKKVLITGNTGFKGSWLQFTLNMLGADTYGISLKPQKKTNPLFFILNKNKNNFFLDIRDRKKFYKELKRINPSIIFHLAAQPYVFEGYQDPIKTYETNTLGTLNLLDSCRKLKNLNTIINITTDKVYLNDDTSKLFKESDRLCGEDPYSNSKSCAELISYTFSHSYFSKLGINLATARAGNIIGGGDFGANRLIPDVAKSIFKKDKLNLRSIDSTRPWISIFFVLKGYLMLAEYLDKNQVSFSNWNFSSNNSHHKTVKEILKIIKDMNYKVSLSKINKQFKEKKYLHLSNKKSKNLIHWRPNYDFKIMIKETLSWYSLYYSNQNEKLLQYSRDLVLKYI